MDFRPACTCCSAWLPVSAPSAETKSSSRSISHRRSAPRRASECSTWTVPRRRTTSLPGSFRVIPFQPSQVLHCLSNSDALLRCTVVAPLVFVEAYYCPRGYYWIPRQEGTQINSSDSDELAEKSHSRGGCATRLLIKLELVIRD